MDELLGQRIGHLRIVERLGVGGMGAVYAAIHEKLGRRVAVKVLGERRRFDPESRGRFQREAQILSQLSHPNICQIHDYVEGDGQDLIVLELVEGQTLRQAAKQGLTEAQRLDAAEQLLAALAAAHSQSIVHRDLKPENVMVTPAGQIKVLDFGLARSADEGSDTEIATPIDIAPKPGPFRTRTGRVTGTIDYMSPEQARGDRATTASDIYSLGLVLQELLTGQRLRSAETRAVQLQRVARGESPTITGVDADLAALIERMKSPSPGPRPSAVDALERLRWIRGKRRRRWRKGLQAAVIAALFLLSLALGWQAHQARQAARQAEQAWAEAESLTAFMLEDLIERLRPLGRLDLLDQIADEAQRYYQGVPPELRSSERRYRHGLALRTLGQVLELEGQFEAAEASYRKLLRLTEELLEESPSDPRYRQSLGRVWDDLGDVLAAQGRLDDAEVAFLQSLEISHGLVIDQPGNPAPQRALSDAWDDLGGLYQQRGDHEQALAAYRQALEVDQRLSLEDPQDVDRRSSLARDYHRIGTIHEEAGELALARAAFEEALAIDRDNVENHPGDTEHEMNLTQALFDLGRVHVEEGNDVAARPLLENAVRLDRRLFLLDPSNARWRASLGRHLLVLGDLEARAGRQREAIETWTEARSVLAPLSGEDYERAAQRLADADGLDG